MQSGQAWKFIPCVSRIMNIIKPWPFNTTYRNIVGPILGADHLTLEEGGGGDFWSARLFFSSNLVGRIFFPLLNALRDIFFSPHFSAGFFFLKKESCLHLHHMNFFEQRNYNFFLFHLSQNNFGIRCTCNKISDSQNQNS